MALQISDVYEEITKKVSIVSLSDRQYCVVMDPVDPATGKNRLGHGKVVKGEASFFLNPGENLKNDRINDIYILGENEGLVLRAIAEHLEGEGKDARERKPGDYWMIQARNPYAVPQLSNLRCMSKSACEGFGPAIRIDSSRRF